MTTPTGQIGMSDVNIEINKASTASVTFNDADVRLLAQVSSGAIGMASMRGKAFDFTYIIPAGSNRNLRTLADAAGYAGQPKVTLTMSATYTATATSVPAVDTGSWPSGTQLTINITGVVTGQGGAGGGGGAGVASVQNGVGGSAAGPAFRITSAITSGSIVINVSGGTVRGGGGGGGGGGNSYGSTTSESATTYTSAGGAGGAGASPAGGATAGVVTTAVGSGGYNSKGGNGGAGGTYGAAGGTGGAGTWPNSLPATPRGNGAGAGGGAGGASFVNSSLATINNSGTVQGAYA